MHRIGLSLALALVVTIATPPAAGQTVVAELFTSQSCSSCPPAEALLGELAERPGVVALEWHVDYWDDLVYGRAGRWQDPFSDPAFTERQRAYNRSIRQSRQIYTPQLVVDGTVELVGCDRTTAELAIQALGSAPDLAAVSVTREGSGLIVLVDGAVTDPATVLLVTFLDQRTTDVSRGENHGRTLVNHHVVTGAHPLGGWQGGRRTFAIAPDLLGPADDCAVLVQSAGRDGILGAAYCPSPSS